MCLWPLGSWERPLGELTAWLPLKSDFRFVCTGEARSMLIPATIAEFLMYSTIMINTITLDGKFGSGTGFFYSIDIDDQTHVPLLITNKHVIENIQAAI